MRGSNETRRSSSFRALARMRHTSAKTSTTPGQTAARIESLESRPLLHSRTHVRRASLSATTGQTRTRYPFLQIGTQKLQTQEKAQNENNTHVHSCIHTFPRAHTPTHHCLVCAKQNLLSICSHAFLRSHKPYTETAFLQTRTTPSGLELERM